MKLLKRENWWIWLLLMIFSEGAGFLALGAILDVYDKNAWYAKWQNWVLGLICFVFPFFIMFAVFNLATSCKVAAKLKVPGAEIYNTPYTWILCIIIPIIGWILFSVMILYIQIEIIIQLYHGNGEAYIN